MQKKSNPALSFLFLLLAAPLFSPLANAKLLQSGTIKKDCISADGNYAVFIDAEIEQDKKVGDAKIEYIRGRKLIFDYIDNSDFISNYRRNDSHIEFRFSETSDFNYVVKFKLPDLRNVRLTIERNGNDPEFIANLICQDSKQN